MFEAAGVRGQIRVGHRIAMVLGRWSLTRKVWALGDVHAAIEAAIVSSDPFWSTQQPRSLWLDMGSAWWVWHGVDVVMGDGSVSLRVTADPEIVRM